METTQRQLNPLFLTPTGCGRMDGLLWMHPVPCSHLLRQVDSVTAVTLAEFLRIMVNNHPHSTNPKRYLWKMVRSTSVLRSSRGGKE